MNIYVWPNDIRWLALVVFAAIAIWAIIVVKRAVVGKHKWFHRDRLIHHT